MPIVWSPLAVDQARDIASYIALDKPSAAELWIDELFKCVERLQEFPESGRVVPEINRKNIREIILGHYRVIYKVTPNRIDVLVVKNYRQILQDSEVGP